MNGDRVRFVERNGTVSVTLACAPTLLILVIFAVFSLGGCAGSEKSNFYMLYPLTMLSPTPANSEAVDASIGIGPVAIPEYLNRPQIVTRTGTYEVDISEFNRWAGSLETSISMVMAENLSAFFSSDRIFTYPWFFKTPDYQVRIEFIQFDGKIPGNVVMIARWSLFKSGTEDPITSRKYYEKKPIAGQGYPGMVSTMSLLLYDMSREIADTLITESSESGTFEGD